VSELDRRLAEVASSQRTLIRLADVEHAGGSRSDAHRRVEGGRWTRLDQGVFALTGMPLDWTTRLLATVFAAGPGAVASHLAAARLHRIPGFERAGLEVSIPRGRRYRRQGVRSHESTDLDRCQVVVRDGVPVTDPGRTLLDLGRYLGVARLTRAVEAARRMGLVTWPSLISTLARHARRGRHGTRRLRAVILANAHRTEITDTDMELLVLGLIRDSGLPEPAVHHRVYDGDRFVAEVDLAYPDLKIAIECDGGVHLIEEVRDRDLEKQNDLTLLGWQVLRFGWNRTRTRPDRVVVDIRDAIASRS
jgi:very-short-patch-repair endonuclease